MDKIKVNVPAYEKTFGSYDAATNSFQNVRRFRCFDTQDVPDVLNGDLELLNVRKIKLIANIPLEVLNNYIMED